MFDEMDPGYRILIVIAITVVAFPRRLDQALTFVIAQRVGADVGKRREFADGNDKRLIID